MVYLPRLGGGATGYLTTKLGGGGGLQWERPEKSVTPLLSKLGGGGGWRDGKDPIKALGKKKIAPIKA